MPNVSLLEELVSRWHAARAQGQTPSAEELCTDCPELLPEFQHRLQALLSMNRFVAMSEPAPERTTPFERVVADCEQFTGQFAAGSARPSIESYLARAPEDVQPSLLHNLLAIDIERRRAAGEQPQVEEYLQRFPQYATLIRDAFVQLSSVSSVGSHETVKPAVAPDKPPAASRLGEYRLVGELGRGGMGVVYEAVHGQRGNRVALKTLPVLDGAALHRFKREFRALADVNHPNLIGLHTLEADGNQWFFTMDLIEGTDFLSHVRPAGVLDEDRLRAALAQLVTGVMALHARHVIHRDLKPSNVMVTAEGRVVVLDFGLVAEQDRTGTSAGTQLAAGTPRYMAPEQAAGLAVSSAADWYAVGVMLYEALSGKVPFSGTLLQVVQDKQRREAPPLPAGPTVPEDLAVLCMRLVAREPQQRPDAREIARAISSHVESASVTPARSGQHLVGREQHLAALAEAHRSLQQHRQPLTVFVNGRSGEGKTTLAEHFLAPLRKDKGLAVMSGRCYDRESVPFKALDSLIDALCSYLRSLSGEDAALLMPDDISMLVQVFPVLERVEVVARRARARLAGLDEQQVRQRAFRALRSLLNRIGERSLIVWFIDDLQWGDADSAEALFEVLRPPEPPPLLFLGAYRSDETEGSAFLTMWQQLQRKHDVKFADREVKLAPLTVAECTELVIDLLGQDTEAIRRRAEEFAQETKGNPFLLIELVGCFDPQSDSFERLPLHEVLARKLGQLPQEAGPLLEVIAVSGQALAPEEAARTAGYELPPMATLIHMRNERLVRLVGPEEHPLIDTYHDRVRETVLGNMDEGRCKTLHRALAEVIEQVTGAESGEQIAALEKGESREEVKAIPRVYDLAYHFDAAGEKEKALSYALLAAEQGRRQHALEVAVQQYAIASRNIEGAGKAVRYRIAEGCGEALMLLGRYEEANKQLEGTIDLTDDPVEKARIEGLQGEIAMKQGALDRSVAFFESGTTRLGHWIPKTLLGLGYGLLRETLIQCWHSWRPKRLHRQAPTSEYHLSIRLFGRLTNCYAFQSTPKVLWSHLVGLNWAELVPPSPGLAIGYAHHAALLSMILGWPARRARYASRGLAMANEFQDVLARGHCYNYQGISSCAAAHYEDALAQLSEAVEAFDKAGDRWELHLAQFHRGRCHLGLGNLAEAIAVARSVFASSARLGDSRVLCSSYLWALATRGNIPFEELKSCCPCRPDDIMSTVHGVMAEGYWHSYHRRTAEALVAFEHAAGLVRTSLCVNFHTVAVMPALAGALRVHADAVQHTDAKQCAALRKRAYRTAKWATRITRLFPTAYAQSLRERSLILAVYGKTKKALKFADKSCAVAEAQNAKYEHAQSLLVRGKLARQLGLPEADEQIRTAEAALEEIERPIRG